MARYVIASLPEVRAGDYIDIVLRLHDAPQKQAAGGEVEGGELAVDGGVLSGAAGGEGTEPEVDDAIHDRKAHQELAALRRLRKRQGET